MRDYQSHCFIHRFAVREVRRRFCGRKSNDPGACIVRIATHAINVGHDDLRIGRERARDRTGGRIDIDVVRSAHRRLSRVAPPRARTRRSEAPRASAAGPPQSRPEPSGMPSIGGTGAATSDIASCPLTPTAVTPRRASARTSALFTVPQSTLSVTPSVAASFTRKPPMRGVTIARCASAASICGPPP